MNPPRLKLRMRDVMTSMAFGVAAGILASVLERIDAAVTGGNATPLGYSNTYAWILLSAYLYGPLGALITTEVQALIGLLTGANPLSWLWPIVNAFFAVVAGSTAAVIRRIRSETSTKTSIVIMSVALAFLDVPAVYFVIVMVLGLPIIAYYLALPVYIGLQLVPSTFLSYMLLKALSKFLKA